MKLDILAFGAHPDDVELSCAGVLLLEKKNGKKTGIIDLTQGELGTRGTIATRHQEASNAALILDVDTRENLAMADGFFQNDELHQRKIITSIRSYQPEIILCNAPHDRHPDHGRASKLVIDAAFLSGLIKIETKQNKILQDAWRPKYVFQYIQDRYIQPNFVIDITAVFDQKVEAIKAYTTQFNSTTLDEPQTYISTPNYLESIIYRHQMFGKMIGVKYAEGFITEKMIGFPNFDSFVKEST